jgi:hypothetical protein
MRTLTCHPSIEVIGQTLLSFIDNTEREEIAPYLIKHGLDHLEPDQWYPLNKFQTMLNDMANGDTSISSSLVAIGMGIVEKMIVPPELETAELGTILMLWNDLYHLQHRGILAACRPKNSAIPITSPVTSMSIPMI